MGLEDYDQKTSKLKYKRELVLLATAVVALIVLVISKLPSFNTPEKSKPDLTIEVNEGGKNTQTPPIPTSQPSQSEKKNLPPSINSGDIPQTEISTLTEQYDTLELLINSQLKTTSLLIDGSEPEIYERTPLVVKARFRHTSDSRKIQLKNDKFTCNTTASFSGKKRLSMTMSSCESN